MYKPKVIRGHKGVGNIAFFKDYVMLDIETTGLSPQNNEIIEIGALKVVDNLVVDTFDMLVRPINRINAFITGLTGISNSMVASAGAIDKVLPAFLDFAGDSVVIGHNISFDINFIYDNCIRCHGKPFKNNYVNTIVLCRRVFPDLTSMRLGYLTNYFNISNSSAHRALSDCYATKELYDIIQKQAIKKRLILEKMVR